MDILNKPVFYKGNQQDSAADEANIHDSELPSAQEEESENSEEEGIVSVEEVR